MKLQNIFVYVVYCFFQFSAISALHAQGRVITGKVFSDTSPTGIAEVRVQVRGAAVQTNALGEYRIMASEGDTLRFSRYGFRVKQLVAGAEDTLDVVLITNKIALPYGTADEEVFTGSAALIRGGFWENRSFTNPLLALQGAGTGVQTTSPSGEPGAAPGIRLRGTSLLGSAGPPLYIVDGTEFTGDLSDLNPADIESMTVLKDAVNRSLYGSRGMNGVVMIKTRTGAGQKNGLDFSMQFGSISNGVQGYPTVSAGEYYELGWQVYRNFLTSNGIPEEAAGQIASGLLPRDATGRQVYLTGTYVDLIEMLGGYNIFNVPDHELIGPDGKLNPVAVLQNAGDLDWMGAVARTGKRNEYNLAYSTGMGRLSVRTSVNYLKEEGWGYRSALERYTGRLNLDYQVTHWWKAGLQAAGARSGSDHPSTDRDALNPFYFAREIGPIYPVHLMDPETGAVVYDATGNKVYDIRALNDNNYPYSRPFFPSSHALSDHERMSDHSVRRLYSGRAFMNFTFLPWLRLDLNAGRDQSDVEREKVSTSIGGPRSDTHQKVKNNSFTFNQVLSAYRASQNIEASFMVGHENVSYHRKDSMTTRLKGSSDPGDFIDSMDRYIFKQKQESYFSKLSLGFFRRYSVDAAYRNDRYQDDLASSDSWSVGGSWNLGREAFFNKPWITRLYTTYGKSGGIFSSARPLAIGMDFALLKNRLQGSLEYYSTHVKDLMAAAHYGEGIFIGKQKLSGMEVSLTSSLVKGKQFSWSLTTNLTLGKDVLTEMPAEIPVKTEGNFRLQKGLSRYSYYTRSFYGVDPESGLPLYRGVKNYDPSNPAIQILGTADTVTSSFHLARQMFVGKSALPKGYGSVINSFRYKGFDLNLLLTYQFGGWVMDNRYMTAWFSGTNFHRDLLSAWKKPGDITDVPRLDKAGSEFTAPSTRWLVRSDYLNLAGVKLSYRISEKTLPFMKVTVFANAENVYFLTHRKGMNTLSFFEQSADSYTYNFARKFNLGLNVSI